LVDQNALLPSFVEIAMNAGDSRRFLEKRIRTTAGQSGISGGDIKVAPLPIPPLAEQHQIVAEVEARISAVDHLEAELDRQITRSNRLRQSVLAAAFRGS
jgi:type I restriction enzyme S subunit